MRWPEAKRRAFAAAPQGTREKLMMGALGALIDASGTKAYVTRGNPDDHK